LDTADGEFNSSPELLSDEVVLPATLFPDEAISSAIERVAFV
jgi:hypothetical protein